MKSTLVIIALLTVYGSLYPFNFTQSALTAQSIQALFNFDITKTQLTNLIANIFLFVPFGFLLRAAFPKYNSAGQLLLLTIIAFLFAYSIQALQLFTEDRQPWGGDAILNMIGYAIGVFLYASLRLDFLKIVKASHSHQQISFFIAFTIIALELAPFAPSIDFDVLKTNIKLLLNSPTIGWYSTFENTVFWLVAFYLLKIAFPNWARINKLSLLVMLILTSKFLIISSNISLSSLVGGILSLLIWKVFSQRINAQQLAILLLITILGNGLYPFELREQVGTFKWLPFSASMEGNLLNNILAFTKKMVFYGGVVWLLYLAKRPLLLGAAICAAMVLLSEFLQIFFTNSVPDSTDFFIVIMVAFFIHQCLKRKSGVNEYQPLQSQSPSNDSNEQLKNTGAQILSKLRKPTKNRLLLVLATLAALAASIGFVLNMSAPKVKVEQVYWAGSKANRMIFDHHAHTTYSDGEKTVAELTELAYINGCDAFSITDHSQDPGSFSQAKLLEIAAMRKKYPVMLIFAGIELGMPSYDGREHVNIITAPEFESETLGAAGHQNKVQIGSYEAQVLPMDRWDPIVASVGGTWDKLLAEGHKIWGAIASSDYHNDKMNYGPCEFSRIHVDAPTKDYSGLIKGIKAGLFWADHGKLLRDYQFTVASKDDGYLVYPGGTIKLMGNKRILSVDITAKRSESYKNDFLRFDLITNCSNDEVLVRSTLLPPEEGSVSLLLPIVEQQGTCFVRSRIVRESLEEHKLSAYSNPIFVVF